MALTNDRLSLVSRSSHNHNASYMFKITFLMQSYTFGAYDEFVSYTKDKLRLHIPTVSL